MIDRDHSPLGGGSSAQTKGLRHCHDAAQLLRGGIDNRTALFSHIRTYSMAIQSASSDAIPTEVGLERQCGMALGDNMRIAREKTGKTQELVAQEIAKATGNPNIGKASVSHWEKNRHPPELQSFIAWCAAVDASADEVLLDKNPDPLLRQLIEIYVNLSPAGRDTVLGKAHRVLSEEKSGPPSRGPDGNGRPALSPRLPRPSPKRPSRPR